MKGTEVPNPRRSSACNCTCVLTRIDNYPVNNSIMTSGVSDALMLALCILSHSFLCTVCSKVSDSLMLATRILFCSCLCKVHSWVSDALWQALCNLPLAFLPDFTLSDSIALIRFIAFSRKLRSAFHLDRKTWSQRWHVFRLTSTAALHCGHTFVGGMLTASDQ